MRMRNTKFTFFAAALLMLLVMNQRDAYGQSPGAGEVTFEIKEINIEGNAIFHDDLLQKVVAPFIGRQKSARDVEKARAALEKYYHAKGYPTALVNIPEQTVESGTIRLEVIESKIRRVRVAGNRYFTRETLLKMMPAFKPGEVLYLPKVKEQLARVNRNQDLKVAPVLMPGKKLGTIDVEFRVKDKLPLHGSLEFNNRSTHTTTDTRINGMLRYDNLWQKEHSIMAQFQTAPEDTEEVKLFTVSYGFPSPLNDDHLVALYGVRSDSDTATAGDLSVVGEGTIVGLRYMIPLPSFESYIHDLALGVDYKDFEDVIAGEVATPVQYLPVYAAYSVVMPDALGQTRVSLGLNFNLRQFSSELEEFQNKRYASKANYMFTTLDIQRDLKLPFGFRVWMRANGRLASQPLISNEQYIAGGVNSVRGYKENEIAGDDAWHGTAELRGPDFGHALRIGKYLELTPYLFYDAAGVHRQDPLEGEEVTSTLSGAGGGIRGYMFRHFEYQMDWATALEDTDDTASGDQLIHFLVKYSF